MAEAQEKESLIQWTIYLPYSLSQELKTRLPRGDRNKWITSAIEEKLARERAESGKGAE